MINSPFASTDRLGYGKRGREGAVASQEEFMIHAFLKDL